MHATAVAYNGGDTSWLYDQISVYTCACALQREYSTSGHLLQRNESYIPETERSI